MLIYKNIKMTNRYIVYQKGAENRIRIESLQEQKSSLFADKYGQALAIVDELLARGTDYVQQAGVCENVITICGERGTGKTSFMLSLSGMLEKLHKECYVASLIDPAHFDSDANLLSMVLGNLANDFQKESGSISHLNTSFEKQKEREMQIRKVYENMQQLQSLMVAAEDHRLSRDAHPFDLKDMAASMNIRESVRNTISSILGVFEKKYIVIQIDDIDLNSIICNTMMEQIRKYLTIENVIVLISVKLDQAQDAVSLKYIEEYKKLYGTNAKKFTDPIAFRYIEKVFPLSRRIVLFNDIVSTNAKLKTTDKDQGQDVETSLLNLIFEKTGYRFPNSNSRGRIVPEILRSYIQLYVMLDNLGDNEDLNKQSFRRYFSDIWIPEHVATEYVPWLQRIHNTADVSGLNKSVVSFLVEKGLVDRKDEIAYITASDNNKDNVSLGDVVYVISVIRRSTSDEKTMTLLFAIETLYRFLLKDTAKYSEADYKLLVAGNYFNGYMRFMQPDRGGKPRAVRRMDISHLRESLQKKSAELSILHLAEIAAIFMSRPRDPKDTSSNPSYRLDTEKYYESSLANTSLPVFDATSIFYNVHYLKETYERFGSGLYEVASSNPESLYSLMCGDDNRCIEDYDDVLDLAEYLEIRTRDSVKLKNFYEHFRDYTVRIANGKVDTFCKKVATGITTFLASNEFNMNEFSVMFAEDIFDGLNIRSILYRLSNTKEFTPDELLMRILRTHPDLSGNMSVLALIKVTIDRPMKRAEFAAALNFINQAYKKE